MRPVLLCLLITTSVTLLTGCDTSMVMTTSVLEKNANAYYDAHEFNDALRYADRLCKRKKDDYYAWQLRSLIHMQLGNNQQALDDAFYAWDLMPDKIDSLRLRSAAYSVNGMHEEAIADLLVIIDQSPRSAGNQVDLGYEYEQLGDYKKAIECYREAVAINENYTMAWNNWASVLSMAPDYEILDGIQAKRYAARAVKLADTDEDRCAAWDTFGAALAELGDYKYARKAAKKAITFTEDESVIKGIKKRINGYKKQEPARYPERAAQNSDATTDNAVVAE